MRNSSRRNSNWNYEKLLTEKQQLELKQSKLIFWGSSLLLVAIIIILLVYMDKKRITIRLFEQLHAIRSQIAENKRTIASYQEQIDSLSLRQSDYDDLQQEKASLEQEVSNLLEQNEKLIVRNHKFWFVSTKRTRKSNNTKKSSNSGKIRRIYLPESSKLIRLKRRNGRN